MKLQYKKILLYVAVFAVILSVMTIPSFASESTLSPGTYQWGEDLSVPPDMDITIYVDFYSNGSHFDSINIQSDGSYYVNVYYYSDGSSILVYDNSDNDPYLTSYWSDTEYRTLEILSTINVDASLKDYLDNNLTLASNSPTHSGWYYDLYDIIVSTVYGTTELTPEQRMVSTLAATCFSFVVIAFPLLCIFWLFKFVCSLGRIF